MTSMFSYVLLKDVFKNIGYRLETFIHHKNTSQTHYLLPRCLIGKIRPYIEHLHGGLGVGAGVVGVTEGVLLLDMNVWTGRRVIGSRHWLRR